MWLLSWKKYSLSKLATFVSVIGAFFRYAGAMCLVSMVIPAAIICFGIGIGLHFWAESIAFGKWTQKLQEAGYDQRIRQGDLQAAIQLYNANPGDKTLKYFDTLNPQVSAKIREQLAAKK